MDNTSIKRISTAHPKNREDLTNILIECEKNNVSIRYVEIYRSPIRQDELFNIGRTVPGRIVTKAKSFESYHQYGLAVDICLLHKDGSISYSLNEDLDNDNISDWMEVVKIFKKYGWSWAGEWKTFKETPHFEKTYNYTTKQLKDIVFNKKELIDNIYPVI